MFTCVVNIDLHHLMINCYLHFISQLKNMISALYSSQDGGTKDFMKNDVTFGWSTIVKIYNADLYRAKNGISRRVPGLKYSYIVRDNWTRLNVLPAKIMQVILLNLFDNILTVCFTCTCTFVQQPFMISAIHELAEKETYIGDHHKRVAEYLEACHKLFEEGILSHRTVSSTDQQLLVNMDKGFQFFQQWKDELSAKYPGMHHVYTK